jgi:hypothetical protein
MRAGIEQTLTGAAGGGLLDGAIGGAAGGWEKQAVAPLAASNAASAAAQYCTLLVPSADLAVRGIIGAPVAAGQMGKQCVGCVVLTRKFWGQGAAKMLAMQMS